MAFAWFLACVLGVILVVPLHFLSVEHVRLWERYGKERGIRIGEVLGLTSGWGFFLFWIGVWFSPQPRFAIPVFLAPPITIPYTGLSVPISHILFSTPFLASGVWLGIRGVADVGLKTAETHRTEKIITKGVYSVVRHPQYLGGLLAHVGITLLLSACFSLLSTPLMVLLNYLLAWKEEVELVREFGEEYEDYRDSVPMFVPRLRQR